jgi:hypothetical protein
LCGANLNFDRLLSPERAGVGEEREALFAVTIQSEERGSFKRFCTP